MKYLLSIIFIFVFTFTLPVKAQDAPNAPECAFMLDPTSTTHISPEGGTGYFTLTNEISSPCLYNPKTTVSWMILFPSDLTETRKTWSFRVLPNTGIVRYASITVNGVSVLGITQDGTITCTFTPSATSADIPANQTNGSFIISAYPGCIWNPVSQVDWITPTSGSWSGSGTLAYTVAANLLTVPRTGTITAGGNTFTITQAGGAKSRKRTRFF